jgi:hypothetical protein
LKTEGGLTIWDTALWLCSLFQEAVGTDGPGFIKYGFYRIPPCLASRELCFGKLSVHQIRRRRVQLSSFPLAFLKGLKKEPFVFLSRKVILKFFCVAVRDFIWANPGQL